MCHSRWYLILSYWNVLESGAKVSTAWAYGNVLHAHNRPMSLMGLHCAESPANAYSKSKNYYSIPAFHSQYPEVRVT